MDKKSKKEKNNDENIDDFLDCDDEEAINNIIKNAEKEVKEESEKKKNNQDDEGNIKHKKKSKKKKKQIEEEEEDEDEDDKEEYRKWKEQRKLEKLKKEKEKEKMKKQKKKKKDESDEDDESDSYEEKKKAKKKSKKKKNYDSDEEEEEEQSESDEYENISKGTSIYKKIKPDDLKFVLNYMKKNNLKYQEGINLFKEGNYEDSLDYLKHAKSSFMDLNKMIQSNKDAYPKEFRNIMSKKIDDKIKAIDESAKKCSKLMKENAKKNIKNNIGNINNNNYNFDAMNNNKVNYNVNNNQNKPKSLHDKEEDEMDQKIESEIMVKNPKVKFNDIIGMKDMKQTLYEIIVVPTIRPDFFTGIRKPQRGILLFGPPGTGKTMIAKAIASECNSTFFNISASSLTSKWVGESEKTVKSLFKIAYKRVPSIIFIDEIDSILSKRSESENEATKRLKTEFLIQFDGLGSNTNAKLLVIAATNRPMDLDEALLRRLPKRIYCSPLDEEGRFEFIKKVINRVETNLSDDDIKEVAQKTNDYSNSDLMELCREAAYQPVRELTTEQILKIKKFRPLVKQDLLNAVKKIRGTLSKKVMDELKRWNDQFGGV